MDGKRRGVGGLKLLWRDVSCRWRAVNCRERPHFRWIRFKGVNLVLLWVIVVPQYEIFISTTSFYVKGLAIVLFSFFQALFILFTCPIAGWLADVYFGRYQVIKVSLWLLWAGAILLSLSLCLHMLLSPSDVLTAVMYILFFVVLLIMVTRIAGFLVNIYPFRIHQLSQPLVTS